MTARISKVDAKGNRSTVADQLPSAVNHLGDVLGVNDVVFVGNTLYALLSGGGCSHGVPNIPASVIRVGRGGRWSVVANLSHFQQTHPVATPEADDFEPDGSWYSMINVGNDLFAVEPNHGELDKVGPRRGDIRRVVDISASQQHIVPTAVAYRKGHFYVGNLNTFPIVPGSSKIFRISKGGHVETFATGFTTVLGLAFDRGGRLYVLETSTAPGFPSPGTGRVVRVNPSGANDVIADSLFFPTGMTFGPDWNLYVSNKGFGPPQPGEILKIKVPGASAPGKDHDRDDD
jgi:hypothetical protein